MILGSDPAYRLIQNQLGKPDDRPKRYHDSEIALLKSAAAANVAGLFGSLGMMSPFLAKAQPYPRELWFLFLIFLVGIAVALAAFFAEVRAANAAFRIADDEAAGELARHIPQNDERDPRFSSFVLVRLKTFQRWTTARIVLTRASFAVLIAGVLASTAYLFSQSA